MANTSRLTGRLCRYEASEYVRDESGRNGHYWKTYTMIADGESARYGDLHTAIEGQEGPLYWVSDFFVGSDYSGSTLEAANRRAFLRDYGDTPGVHEIFGGYDTQGIAIRMDALDDEENGILDEINRLENYPVVDDEELSRLEMELADEAWDLWAESDFARALEKEFLISFDSRPDREFFERMAERANCYWESEGGGGPSVTIRVERVAKAVTLDDLLGLPSWQFDGCENEETLNSLLESHRDGNVVGAAALHDFMEENA